MHPVVRIVCFLVFALFVAAGGAPQWQLGALLLGGVYLTGRWTDLHPALIMLRRMRWLFLSIVLLYLFFSVETGTAVAGSWDSYYHGLLAGAERVAVLVMLVLAVNRLLIDIPMEQRVPAVVWLLAPLAWLGISRERLAMRLALTLEAVTAAPPALTAPAMSVEMPRGLRARWQQRIESFARRVGDRFQASLDQAAVAELRTLSLHQPVIAWPQWVCPAALAGLFVLASHAASILR